MLFFFHDVYIYALYGIDRDHIDIVWVMSENVEGGNTWRPMHIARVCLNVSSRTLVMTNRVELLPIGCE